MRTLPSLDIVIVNWNAGDQLADCVRSIEAAERSSWYLRRTVIVDNGSADGSLDHALASTSLPVVAIRNLENRGFARACNQGAAGSESEYVLFLNPDARLFADSLSAPIAFLEDSANADVGVCGVRLLDSSGETARSCARAPTPASMAAASLGLDRIRGGFLMREWDHSESRDVDHVIGAFYLVRREAFAALGGFDERFFVYLEDLDFSLRAKRAGWRVRYLASTSAFHKGGGASERAKARRLAYSLESRLRFSFKHFSPVSAAGVAALTLLAEPGLRLARAAAQGSPSRAAETVGGYALLAASIARAIAQQTIGAEPTLNSPRIEDKTVSIDRARI